MSKQKQCRPFDSRYLQLDLTDNQREIYLAYGENGSIVNKAARAIGKEPGGVSRAIRDIQKKGEELLGHLEWDEYLEEVVDQPLRILVYDIETMPNLVYTWGFYNQNISHNQVKTYGWMCSFAAKWIGEDEIIYHEYRGNKGNDKSLVKKLIDLFDQADVVIAHNGRAFDTKTAKGRALKYGINPPSPFKVADTLLIAKNEFKLPRNTLEYIAEHVGVTPKDKHEKFPGFELWRQCLEGNEDAWKEMREYNIQDIETLEEVYYALRPWATQHPNLGIFLENTRKVCPKCASPELKAIRKVINTNTQSYSGYECKNCGGYCRGRRNITDKEKKKSLLVNAV